MCNHHPPHLFIGGERDRAAALLRAAIDDRSWQRAGELVAQLGPCHDPEAPRPRNGADVVDVVRTTDGWLILATWQAQWAVWQMDAAGETFFGSYYPNRDEAGLAFQRRVGRLCGSAIANAFTPAIVG